MKSLIIQAISAIITKTIIVAPAILLIQKSLLKLTADLKSPTTVVRMSHQVAAPKKTPVIKINCPKRPEDGCTTLKLAKKAIKRKTANGFEIVRKNVEIKS